MSGLFDDWEEAGAETLFEDWEKAGPGQRRETSGLAKAGGFVGATGVRVVGTMAGGLAGTIAGPKGTVLGGIAGAAASEGLAQAIEHKAGLRDQPFNFREYAVNSLAAGVPATALRAADPTRTVGQHLLRRGGEGALLAGTTEPVRQIAAGQPVDPWGILAATAFGSAFGAGVGRVEISAFRRAVIANAFRQHPSTAENVKGMTDAEVLTWARKNMPDEPVRGPENARPVEPAGADTTSTSPAQPEGPTMGAEQKFLQNVEAAAQQKAVEAQMGKPKPYSEEIEYAPWETEGSQPLYHEPEDNLSDWVDPPPQVIALRRENPGREVDSMFDPVQVPVVEVPVALMVLDPEIPQFKANAGADGVVEGNKIEGTEYKRVPANPVALLERLNGVLAVITGRHRRAYALEIGEETIPAQILREADGITVADAVRIDAHANIRDGQGTVADYSWYFRNDTELTEDRAKQEGLLGRVAGRNGWILGRQAETDLYDLYRNGQIAESKALAVAIGAPNNGPAQRLALKDFRKASAEELEIRARMLAAMQGNQGDASGRQLDFTDMSGDFAALEEQAIKVAKAAAEEVAARRELISSSAAAARRPEAARKMGVQVGDAEGIQRRIAELTAEIDALKMPRGHVLRQLLAKADGRQDEPISFDEPEPSLFAPEGDGEAPPPAEVVPEDPNQISLFEEAGEYQAKVRRVKKLRDKGDKTLEEIWELEDLERELGQQDLFDLQRDQDAARRSRALAERNAAILKEMEERRLLGGSLDAQQDLFRTGPAAAPGQMSLFENPAAGRKAMRQRGVPEDQLDLALDWTESAQKAVNALAHTPDYPQSPIDTALFRPDRGSPSPGSEEGRLDTARRIGELLADPITNAPAIAAALRSGQRVSTVLPELVRGGIPALPIKGMQVRSPADAAMLLQVIRNPYQERWGALVLDKRGNVLAGEVLTLGTSHQSLVDVAGIARLVQTAGPEAHQILTFHNHPSGVTTPSTADIQMARQLRVRFEKMGLDAEDFLVLNGNEFTYGSPSGGFVTLPYQGTKQPWEIVSRSGEQPKRLLSAPDKVAELARQLSVHDPRPMIAFLDRKNHLSGLAYLPDITSNPNDVRAVLNQGIADTSATAFIAMLPSADGVNDWTRKLGQMVRSEFLGTDLLDVVSPEGKLGYKYSSAREAGLLEPPARYGERGAVQEPSAIYDEPFDPSRPFAILSKNGLYAKVELAGLDQVPIVEMPEMVELIRQVTGQVPKLKRFRGALGIFKPMGDGLIALDRRIFSDYEAALKTMAHEMGHLVDYFDQRTMQRGNLLGRLAKLREYLRTTINRLPGGSDQSLTPKDRAKIRRQAEKQVGPRPPKDEEAELAEWRLAVSAKYRELIEVEIAERDLLTVEQAREELIAVSDYWKPIPWDAADDPVIQRYIEYRLSGQELYADAMSVLFNSPKTLQDMAPNWWKSWWAYVESMPEMAEHLQRTWDYLHRGKIAVLSGRRAKQVMGFKRAEDIWMRKAQEREARRNSWSGTLDKVVEDVYDANWPLLKKAVQAEKEGRVIPWDQDPRKLFDEHPLAENRNFRLLQQVRDKVQAPLEEVGLNDTELSLYLLNRRILDVRSQLGIANPGGHTPETARLQMLDQRLRLGIEKMTRLEAAAAKFHDLVFNVVELAVDAGVYSREQYETVLLPNKDTYAAFAVVDYLENSSHVPATIRQMTGTLSEVAPPFTTTLMKMLTLNRWVGANLARRDAASFLSQYFPAEIQKAKIHRSAGGRPSPERPPENMGQIMAMEDGQPVWYNVDKGIERMFTQVAPADMHAAMRGLNWAFREIFYPTFITYNPAFLFAMSPKRDLSRTWRNLPKVAGVGLMRYTKALIKSYPDVKRYLRSETKRLGVRQPERLRGEGRDPAREDLIAEMMENFAVGLPWENYSAGLYKRDHMATMMRDFHLAPPEKAGKVWDAKWFAPMRALLEAIKFHGLVFEFLPKTAAYRMLREDVGLRPAAGSHYVRNYAGVPNSHKRGRQATMNNSLMPFINVALKGYAADASLAMGRSRIGNAGRKGNGVPPPPGHRPRGAERTGGEAGTWWLRYFLESGGARILMAAGAAGFLGNEIKEMYDRVGSFEKTNFGILPIGKSPGGEFGWRTTYIRIPEDETDRVLGGLIHLAIQRMGRAMNEDQAQPTVNPVSDMLGFAGGQLPGLNPVLTLSSGWSEYLAGGNPRDPFRGRPVLPGIEHKAGGREGLLTMLEWTFDQTGVSNFVRWDRDANHTWESALGMAPVLNRLLRVTDQGQREAQWAFEAADEQMRARLRLEMGPEAVGYLSEWYRLTRIDEARQSDQQLERKELLRVWYSHVYAGRYEQAIQLIETGDPRDARDAKLLMREIRELSEDFAR